MAYLATAGEFEKAINRGLLSHRSSRLDGLVQAIADYIKSQRRSHLLKVQDRLLAWKSTDPKEYADRASTAGPRLASEVSALLENWGQGEIRVADPGAHPTYQPWIWNSAPIQYSTNCYAYACNDPYHHPYLGKPQPGQAGRVEINQVTDAAVRLAVMCDDQHRNHMRRQRLSPLIRLRDEGAPACVANMPGYYLIALFVAPGVDYHWARQDRDGMWSHKPGWDVATDLDSAGRPIADPRDCDMRLTLDDPSTRAPLVVPYEFSTFYYAPRLGVRTGDLGNLHW